MSKVWTPTGLRGGLTNSLVGKGETIYNPGSGNATLVTKGKVGVDNQPSSVSLNDDNVILGNDIEWSTGKSFADLATPHTVALENINKIYDNINKNSNRSSLAKRTLQVLKKALADTKNQHRTALNDLADRQATQHKIEDYTNIMAANKGKDINRYDDGKSIVSPSERFAGVALPMANALAQGFWWGGLPIHYRNTYSANPHESAALNTLAGLRNSPYTALRQTTQSENEAAYQNTQAGGLTASQRNANRLALALGSQRNVANIHNQAQHDNNAYRSQWANSALQAGQSDRQALMQAMQHDNDVYDKAHGAKVRGIETAMANMNNIWQTLFADAFKIKMADKTLGLYNQQLNADKAAIASNIAASSNRTAAPVYRTPYYMLPMFNVPKFTTTPSTIPGTSMSFKFKSE